MTTVLLISRCPPYPLHWGDRLIIWHLAREFAKRGITLDLLAFAQFPQDHDDIDAYASFFRKVTVIDERRRTPIMLLERALLANKRFPRRAQEAWSSAMWQAIEAHLQSNHYDVVHLFGGVHVYEFAHLLREIPTLITPYESYSLYLQRAIAQGGGWMTRLNQVMARHYESWMFSPYARVVVLTEQDRDEMYRANPDLAIDVIPNGIDLDRFPLVETTRDPFRLLFTGNFEYAPNLDAGLLLAQKILPRVRQAIPEAQLFLVGNAPPPILQACANDYVHVTGHVPDMQPYLAQATIFACPLRIGAGIKNKVLEALAMGLPVIATPLSIEGIRLENGQDVVVARVDDFAEALINLLRDTDRRQRLAQNGRRIIEAYYSWSGVAEQYLALYEALVVFRRTLKGLSGNEG